MELHSGSVPGNESACRGAMISESACRIPVNVDLAELNALLDTIPSCGPVIDDRGFTRREVMQLRKISTSQAHTIITKLIEEGKVKHIGRRSGRNGAKVFELITPQNGK